MYCLNYSNVANKLNINLIVAFRFGLTGSDKCRILVLLIELIEINQFSGNTVIKYR